MAINGYDRLGHDDAVKLIEAAPKEKLILALRAVFTARLWEATEEELRAALHSMMHEEAPTTPEEIINALTEGA